MLVLNELGGKIGHHFAQHGAEYAGLSGRPFLFAHDDLVGVLDLVLHLPI